MARALGRLVTLVRRGSRPACVLLPGAGGGLHPYLRLAGVIGATHDVYAVRAAGLVPDEDPEDSIAAMVDSAITALDGQSVDPVMVFGWSLGGVVGWELCVRLAERGRRPDLIVVDASPLPRPSTQQADAMVRDVVVRMLGPRPDAGTTKRVLDAVEAQIHALVDHHVRTPYAGRVLLLACTDNDMPGRTEAVARWRELAPDLRTEVLDAGHFAVFEQEHLPQLAGFVTGFMTGSMTPEEVAT